MAANDVHIMMLGAAGYMGGNGLLAIPQFIHLLAERGFKARLTACVDPSIRSPKNAENWLHLFTYLTKELHCVPRILPVLDETLSFIETIKGDALFVYDASPAGFHTQHLQHLLLSRHPNFTYVGEKPLFTDHNDIVAMNSVFKDTPFYCEFIETQNPLYIRLKEYLETNKCQIERMTFWRAGSSGVKKLIGADRDGVAGGALFDKGPHDLSMTAGLLGVHSVRAINITNAEIGTFIPHRRYVESGEHSLLSVSNEPTMEVTSDFLRDRLALPADGLFSAETDWEVSDDCALTNSKRVRVRYLFSWVGATTASRGAPPNAIESDIVRQMAAHNIMENRWLLRHDERGPMTLGPPPEFKESHDGFTHECVVDDVRIGILECVDRTIICNFLPKADPVTRKTIFPLYLKAFDRSAKLIDDVEIDQTALAERYRDLKGLFLARVFDAAFADRQQLAHAPEIGRAASILVHDTLLRLQNAAFENLGQLKDPATAFARAASVTNSLWWKRKDQ